MLKKLIGALSLSILLLTGSVLPAMAQTTATPSKTEVAVCMKAATAKKKLAMDAARADYKAALAQAKGKEGKAKRAAARQALKKANDAAKEAFAADRKACTAKAPATGGKY